MKKTFKYRLLGNNKTFAKAENCLYLCRWLYNTALSQRISIYKQNKGKISCYEQNNQLPELKKTFPEYASISSQSLQDVIERLDKAYKNFFRRVKKGEDKVGFPRFKSKGRYDSFTLKDTGWILNKNYLIIEKIGKFKLRLSRPIEGNIKTITVNKESTGKWYVCFNCDNVPEKKLPESDESIGLDVGIKSYLTDSEGNKVENPKFLKKALSKLRRKQRKLSRAERGSNRRKNTKIQVAKCHEEVRNQRGDFLHKLANDYIKNYDTIYVENLQIENMVKNHKLARDIDDCSWSKFFGLLSYKAVETGRKLVKVNPRYTSMKCSNCGEINHELKLSDRKWVCISCGALHDRDYNAAKNIKRVGQTQQALTCENTQSVVCKSPQLTKRGVSSQGVMLSKRIRIHGKSKRS
jgi:putative transposase